MLKGIAAKLNRRVGEAVETVADYERTLRECNNIPSFASAHDLGVKFVRLEVFYFKMLEEQEEFICMLKQHSDAPVAILTALKSFHEKKVEEVKEVEKSFVAGKAHAVTQSAVKGISAEEMSALSSAINKSLTAGGSIIGPLSTLPHSPCTHDEEETGSEWSYTDASSTDRSYTDRSYTDRTDYTASTDGYVD